MLPEARQRPVVKGSTAMHTPHILIVYCKQISSSVYVFLITGRISSWLATDDSKQHEKRNSVCEMKRIFLSAVQRIEQTELASQARGLVPAEDVEHYADLLWDVLERELRCDDAVETVTCSSPRSAL